MSGRLAYRAGQVVVGKGLLVFLVALFLQSVYILSQLNQSL